mgnify:CR=1 FL=1
MSDNDELRPSPEALLKLAKAEEEAGQLGKLKIFLGYAAGVGKTYAMLEAAWQRRLDRHDVVAAYVESHGRFETDSLLAGLEIVPPAIVVYQGVELKEMDLDAVLARKPEIALVDELAHTNAPGSRHEKRWQDIEELLAAGIDVFTTVNIQHFESLNDIVAQITGIAIRETVPDSLLDRAEELRLVDIPPEDLLERLREGKVYIPAQAALAMERFFQPGNLMALRELSLRRAASRVDDQMREYMETRSIAGPWSTAERLLVCVSGSPYSEKLIRTTRRLADELKAPWITAYIETPGDSKFVRENRERVWHDLRLAESLGAQVATITAPSVPEALIDYAVRHNVSKIVVGKPAKPRWRELLHPPIVDQIIRKSGQIDVMVVSFAPSAEAAGQRQAMAASQFRTADVLACLGLVAGATLLCELARPFLDPTNMVMAYLLAVVLAAIRFGQKPAILTAVLGVLAFDFFFVPPRLTLAVADTEYFITFATLLIVGLVISALVSKARRQAEALREREGLTDSLYHLSRDLGAAVDQPAILSGVIRNIEGSLAAQVAVFLEERDRLNMTTSSSSLQLDMKERAVADWAFRNHQAAGRGTDTLGSAQLIYLPLQASGTAMGVLGLKLPVDADYRSEPTRRLLDAFCSQVALALERVEFTRQLEQAQLLRSRENLERALLNSISHDLRSPLATITGVLSSFRDDAGGLSEPSRRDLLENAWEEVGRLNRFVGNLLDMTRLEAGAVRPNLEPCDIQDLIGCAVAAFEHRLQGRQIDIQVAPDLPMVSLDMVLMTQVLINVLDNALKYSSVEQPVTVEAKADADCLMLEVTDRGPGVREHELKWIFDKFYRVPVPEGVSGTGLGLSICKGFVEAHGGKIRAMNRDGGGLRVIVTLPLAQGAPQKESCHDE